MADREAVQHREAVEPVAHALLADLELGRAGAQQRSPEPGGQLAAQRQLVDGHLVIQRREADPGCRRLCRYAHNHSSGIVRTERYEPYASLAAVSAYA